jgi:hypothetical protein
MVGILKAQQGDRFQVIAKQDKNSFLYDRPTHTRRQLERKRGRYKKVVDDLMNGLVFGVRMS